MSQEPILNVQNLETSFDLKQGTVKVISDLSYQIYPGEILGIVGESGCGKSVTSLTLMGLLPSNGKITHGHIYFNQQDLTTFNPSQMEALRGGQISMIFQEPMTALNPVMTVGEQIIEQILTHQVKSKKEAKEWSMEMLNLVGIPSASTRLNQYPHELSGGMRQRVMIAMALSTQPKLLIADEPTTALDVTIQAQILELIQDLQERFKMSVQFITHDLGVISELADRVLVMYGGYSCEVTRSEDLFKNPRHPYTKALIEARPKMGQKARYLQTIEGSVPSLLERPTGCPFQNRCPRASQLCREQLPLLTDLSPGHAVRCFHPLEG